MPIPGVRGGAAKKPKPFQRPGIDLSSGSKKRWVSADPQHIEVGDIIRGEGLVEKIDYQRLDGPSSVFSEARARFTMKNGKVLYFNIGEPVVVFTEAEGEPVG